jgi:hypothetical protein
MYLDLHDLCATHADQPLILSLKPCLGKTTQLRLPAWGYNKKGMTDKSLKHLGSGARGSHSLGT